ncbi:hypothetical protein [Blastococcus sp. TML/C7B]|uniref:hypothetical protein n=1 Tax=Blastococcus sp. TML/C7B TaxID=2798728 RepID=UPI001F5B060E|nr:hypothetical protein [Blastococcus sp. TML/C7B]
MDPHQPVQRAAVDPGERPADDVDGQAEPADRHLDRPADPGPGPPVPVGGGDLGRGEAASGHHPLAPELLVQRDAPFLDGEGDGGHGVRADVAT